MTLQRALVVLLALAFMMPTVFFLLKALLGATARLVAAAWCIPPVAMFLAVKHQLHMLLLLLCIVLPFKLPAILGHRPIAFSTLMPIIIFAGMIARLCLGLTAKGQTDRKIDLPLFVTSTMIIGWNVIDRPGMASMGSETGGAWEAILAIAAILAYWGIRSLRFLQHNWKQISIILFWACFLSLLWITVENIAKKYPIQDILANFFWPTGWWFYGLLLGYTLKISRAKKGIFRNVPLYLIIAFIMFNSLVSGFRSRILFAPMMIGAALWTGGMRKQMTFAVATFAVVCITMANSNLYERVPARMQRVLSVVRWELMSTPATSLYGHGEMGMKSPWRAELWKRGWEAVRKKPIAGHGYAFDSSALLADIASAETFYEARMRGVATAGQFHNLPLNIMFFCGIPISILFCFAWLNGIFKLVKIATKSKEWMGVFFVALLVYVVPETGQALMNGSGEDFIAVCTWLGIVQATYHFINQETESSQAHDDKTKEMNMELSTPPLD